MLWLANHPGRPASWNDPKEKHRESNSIQHITKQRKDSAKNQTKKLQPQSIIATNNLRDNQELRNDTNQQSPKTDKQANKQTNQPTNQPSLNKQTNQPTNQA